MRKTIAGLERDLKAAKKAENAERRRANKAETRAARAERKHGNAVGWLTLLILGLLIWAVVAVLDNNDGNSDVTTVTTIANEATATTAGDTTATTIVDPEDTVTNEVSGNLLVTAVATWEPTFNAGDLVLDSTMCTFFASETEAYAWLNAIRLDSASDEEFIQLLNERYGALREQYWMDAPPAAALNMMEFMTAEKPWLPQLTNAVFGEGSWNANNPRHTMVLVTRMLWTDVVAVPASFRTTGCYNSVGADDPGFREVFKGQNVVISPDDADWVPTLVDVVLPSHIKSLLQEMGSNVRIQQTQGNDGMQYEVRVNGVLTKIIEIERSVAVSVIIHDVVDGNVAVEAVFSTACGNPTLPEFTPPRKTEETTTTSSSTTTTVPETTTTSSSTTTTVPVTTTTVPTTTTTQPPTFGADLECDDTTPSLAVWIIHTTFPAGYYSDPVNGDDFAANGGPSGNVQVRFYRSSDNALIDQLIISDDDDCGKEADEGTEMP